MGYTFIALQGFDLIAAVAGEVRDPKRTVPRAMLLSLGIALSIYLPLLFIIATVGVKAGDSITSMSAKDPATVVAVAARNYLGAFGFWLVILAAILSRQYTEQAIHTLVTLMQSAKHERTRLAAASELLDRGYGRPPQAVDFGGPIQVMNYEAESLAKLTDDELRQLDDLTRKITGQSGN